MAWYQPVELVVVVEQFRHRELAHLTERQPRYELAQRCSNQLETASRACKLSRAKLSCDEGGGEREVEVEVRVEVEDILRVQLSASQIDAKLSYCF